VGKSTSVFGLFCVSLQRNNGTKLPLGSFFPNPIFLFYMLSSTLLLHLFILFTSCVSSKEILVFQNGREMKTINGNKQIYTKSTDTSITTQYLATWNNNNGSSSLLFILSSSSHLLLQGSPIFLDQHRLATSLRNPLNSVPFSNFPISMITSLHL
jgi:hypothetical protein